MLRRSKTIIFDDEPESDTAQEPPRRPSLRRNLDALRPAGPRIAPVAPAEPDEEAEPAPANPVNQRFDFLRSELEQAPISRGSQESLAALREEFRRKHVGHLDDAPALPRAGGLKPSRLVLILVALVAGGLAAFLAIGRPAEPAPVAPEPVVVQQIPAPTVEILVARAAIAPGTRLSADLLQWQSWPEAALRPEYTTIAADPTALDALGTFVARTALVPGEPILRDKLREAGGGYLSVLLDPGTRAVSVAVDAKSASGGFIVPGDRVDIVLTSVTNGTQSSRTILTNARVLAINARLGDTADANTAQEELFSQALATLELTPDQAELIVNAALSGQLSLVLRPLTDATAPADAAQQPLDQTIRLTSPFWTGSAPTAAGIGAAPHF